MVEEDKNKMFGPLTFQGRQFRDDNPDETSCLLCSDTFNLNLFLEIFIGHLFDVHNLIIEDVQNIPNLHEYITYWKKCFEQTPIESIIPSVRVDPTDLKYFVLSDLTKQDKQIRHKIRLEHVLKVQEYERTDGSYIKQCLFCRLQYEGTRQNFLQHLAEQHNLQLGNCQNLVFIEELIEKIDEMLNQLRCIFCEKTFTDRVVLKEHMRKKLHKRINPQNKFYDRFYMVNYLEPDKTWKAIEKEDDNYALSCQGNNSDDEYSDWNDEDDRVTCLFCDQKQSSIGEICHHMIEAHSFDFCTLTQSFDFYQKIKLVNYIRRQIHSNCCVYCDLKCDTKDDLRSHLLEESHYRLPDCRIFDQPEFYFPTYENDAFLYLIDDVD